MCFSLEPGRVDDKEMVSIGLKRYMLELAQSCFKDTCHDTIFPAITSLAYVLLRHFDELQYTRGTASATRHLSDVLYEHSATLRHVELTGYLRREAWILHLVKTMRSELQLESCRVRFECDDYPVLALRQLLRLLAGSEIISNRV